MSTPQKNVSVVEARNAGERRWNERSYHFFFNYCYYYWNTKREPLRRREAWGTRKRNAKWLGCGRSGLALFAGSHRSTLEKNSSLEPTLCQGVAVPSAFFVFSPGGRVRPRTLIYLLSTPLLWVFTQNPIPISVSDQNNFIFNILLSWICMSGHFGFSSDKYDGLIAILLDHFRRLFCVRVIQNFQKSPSSRVSQSRCTRVYFERGLLPCPNRRKGFDGW